MMLPRMLLVTAAMSCAMAVAVAAFSDREFCDVAKQVAIAAEQDVGNWTDRTTRNAGIIVDCTDKVVQFKRFTYLPTTAFNDAWKQRTSTSWNARHCSSAIWREAVKTGWKVQLGVWSADGGHASMLAQCD